MNQMEVEPFNILGHHEEQKTEDAALGAHPGGLRLFSV